MKKKKEEENREQIKEYLKRIATYQKEFKDDKAQTCDKEEVKNIQRPKKKKMKKN